MKLASLPGGRDGRLAVVSTDLAWYADAAHLVPTLQALLDDWDRHFPVLQALATVGRQIRDPAWRAVVDDLHLRVEEGVVVVEAVLIVLY